MTPGRSVDLARSALGPRLLRPRSSTNYLSSSSHAQGFSRPRPPTPTARTLRQSAADKVEAKARLEDSAAKWGSRIVIRLAAARRWPLVTGIEAAIHALLSQPHLRYTARLLMIASAAWANIAGRLWVAFHQHH